MTDKNHQTFETNHKNVIMFTSPPEDFTPSVEVAAIYVEAMGRVLLLQIANHKKEGGFWGVPAGKIEKGETSIDGAARELFEETGIVIPADHTLTSMGSIYFRKPTIDYIYHAFSLKFDDFPPVTLSDEHQNYRWITLEESQTLNLMAGGHEALNYYFLRRS